MMAVANQQFLTDLLAGRRLVEQGDALGFTHVDSFDARTHDCKRCVRGLVRASIR